jgi:hypothetical protein
LKASDAKRKTVLLVVSWWPEKVEERPSWGVSSDKALGKKKRRNAPPHVLRVRQAGRGDFGQGLALTESPVRFCEARIEVWANAFGICRARFLMFAAEVIIAVCLLRS